MKKEMKHKLLFDKFLDNKRIYNLNQGYWKRQLQSKLKIKLSKDSQLFSNVDAKGNKIYDANPIFTFVTEDKSRAVRIIQDDATIFEESTDENDKFLMSAWIDDFIFDNSKTIPELVIVLFLTKETVNKSVYLISRWMSNNIPEENLEEILNSYHP